MELETEITAFQVAHESDGRIAAATEGDKPRRRRLNTVAVRHPDRLAAQGNKWVVKQRFHFGRTVFPFGGGSHFAAQGLGQGLHPVTDAQDR